MPIEIKTIDAPLRLGSFKECLDFEKESFGALRQLLSGLSESEKEKTWVEIEQELKQFQSNGSYKVRASWS